MAGPADIRADTRHRAGHLLLEGSAMQIQINEVEALLNIGSIDFEVGADMHGGYAARTAPTLTSADLGATIEVSIDFMELEEDDAPEEGSVAMFKELINRTKDAIAVMGMTGTLYFRYGGLYPLDEEEQRNFIAAIDEVGYEGSVHVTIKDVVEAKAEQRARDVALGDFFRMVYTSMAEKAVAKGLTKEEREKMTLGETLDLDDEYPGEVDDIGD